MVLVSLVSKHLYSIFQIRYSNYNWRHNHFDIFFEYDQRYWFNNFKRFCNCDYGKTTDIDCFNMIKPKKSWSINIHNCFDKLNRDQLFMLKYYILFYNEIIKAMNKVRHRSDQTSYFALNLFPDHIYYGIYMPKDLGSLSIKNSKSIYLGKWITNIFEHIPKNSKFRSFTFSNTSVSDNDIVAIVYGILNENPKINISSIGFTHSMQLTPKSYYLLKFLVENCTYGITCIDIGYGFSNHHYGIYSFNLDKRRPSINTRYKPWFTNEIHFNKVTHYLASQYTTNY